jgi:hypothetical protein
LKYKISKSRRNLDDLLDSAVGDSRGVAQVEDTEMIIRPIGRERKKSGVIDQVATTKAKLTERVAFGEERSNWLVADVPALLEIDFQDVGAIFSKGKNRLVLNLRALIELELY